MDCVAEGSFEVDDFDPSDVFIVDLEKSIYVWVGEGKAFIMRLDGGLSLRVNIYLHNE